LADLPTPVEVKELKFEDFSSESIDITDSGDEMNPDFDRESLPEELRDRNSQELGTEVSVQINSESEEEI
jgi:segregation and condensation protein B